MSSLNRFNLDGEKCMAWEGATIVDAARENDKYIPTLCNLEGVPPKGACRVCTVKVNGKLMTACTTKVTQGMQVESDTPELNDLRKSIVEMMFVEGNHLCPSCEKSGDCELQALGYRYKMTVPRYPYFFPKRDIDSTHPKIIKDHNRCILCKRCIRAIKDKNGQSIFAFLGRGFDTKIYVDPDLAENLTDELADKSVEVCPVGAIMKRGVGFKTPIGQRRYDHQPIGSDIEK
ncbi:2Fe-2S iron-sulfur cluster-binding protein [Natronogracilivirga saccharolytica]|uniref:(2Fe-2S)-binding protein n=1 Tax=Natronogracilivirga saccharolytica TaxID=2812953 RepID=A0A8J7UTV3_9BACT|nr:2Fe-2S iron-sulfur cluster-binding protein [Natronogracilivirga saccharolytica]MBP3191750.1 (2Fe-2S)-binding protein [Natronogracilivirga saccharolytica]